MIKEEHKSLIVGMLVGASMRTTPLSVRDATKKLNEALESMQKERQALPSAEGKEAECDKCGTKLELSAGWTPSYNDPDNSGLAPNAEPYCPKCDEAEGKEEVCECKICIAGQCIVCKKLEED